MSGGHTYRVHGLRVQSDWTLPCSPSLGDPVDIRFQHGGTAEPRFGRPTGSVGPFHGYDTTDGVFVSGPDRLRMFVDSDGRTVSIEGGRDPDFTAMFALGTGLSLCLLFRGSLPLHAAAVAVEDGAVAILANSGVGKSSLMWEFVARGLAFVCDDLLPIHSARGLLACEPSEAVNARMWQDSIVRFGIEELRGSRVMPDEEKYWVEIPSSLRVARAIPPRTFAILRPDSDKAGICAEQLVDHASLRALVRNTHALWCLPRPALSRVARLYGEVIRGTTIYEVTYPREAVPIAELADFVMSLCARPSTISGPEVIYP